MKNLKSKKLVSLFLTMLMLLSCMSIFAVNAEIDTSHGRNVKVNMIKSATYTEGDCEVSGNSLVIVENKTAKFTVNAPATGVYNVTLNGVYVGGATWFRFYNADTNAQLSAGVLPASTGDVTEWMANYPTETKSQIKVTLQKGENNLKLSVGNRSSLTDVTFTAVESTTVGYNDFEYVNGKAKYTKNDVEKNVKGNVTEAWVADGGTQQWNYPVMVPKKTLGIDANFLVGGQYKVTMEASTNPNYTPKFVLKNNTTGESLTRETLKAEGGDLYNHISEYEMGFINVNAGDYLTIENTTSGGDACFKGLKFTWVGEIVPKEEIVIDAKSIILDKSNCHSIDTNSGSITLTGDGKNIVFNIYVPIEKEYLVSVNSASTYGGSADWVRFYDISGTNEKQIASGIINGTGSDVTQWKPNNSMVNIKVPLKKGNNQLKVTIENFITFKGFTFRHDPTVTVNFADFDYVNRNNSITKDGVSYTIEKDGFKTVWEKTGWSWEWAMPVMADSRNTSLIFDQSINGTYKVSINAGGSGTVDTSPKFEVINEMTGKSYTVETNQHGEPQKCFKSEIGTFDLKYGDVITINNKGATTYLNGLVFEKVESIKVNGDVDGSLKGGDNTVVVPANFDSKLTSNAVIFGAVYNDGVLYSVDMKDYSQTEGATLNLKAPSDLTKVTYKIFFWEKETLKPILSTYPAVDTTTNTVYVSKKGFDMNNGNEATPVASLQRAKELANEKKSSIDSDIEVIIGEGEYNLENELFFLGADSGNGDHKIIYRGAENGKTVINGGVKLENWISDGNLKVATNDKIKNKVRHLSVNDGYTAMSRSPKITNGITVSGNNLVIENSKLGSFDKEKLKNEKNAEVYGVMGFSDVRIPVKEFIVGDSSTTIVFDPTSTDIHDYTKTIKDQKTEIPTAQRFVDWIGTHNSQYFGGIYIENALAFTDSAGEYYCDTQNHKIYYYTANSVENMEIYAPISEGILNFDGVKNVTIENITFKNGTWNRPSVYGMVTRQAEKYDVKKNEYAERGGDLVKGQITLNNCENVVIKNNTLKNIGSTAIALRLNNKNCEVSGNTITNTAGGAISVGHLIDREKNTQNIVVKNNNIDNVGLQYRSCPAITVYFANGVQILHNDINNVAYTGISLGLSWTEYVANVGNYEVAYNKVANVMTETDDGSHIYTNGPIFGTKIHDNYLLKGNGWPNGQNSPDRGGIYFDNGSCDIEAYNNVIEQCGTWLFAVDTRLGKYCPNNGINCSDCNNRTCKETELKVHDNYTDTNVVVNSATNTITVTNTVSNTSTNAVNIKNVAGVEK